MEHPYNKEYYDTYGHNGGSYDGTKEIKQTLELLADALCEDFMFMTHLDIGCAFGYVVDQMWQNGVRSKGIDISEYAISKARRKIRPNLSVHDISQKPILSEYDLVTCIEVIEHIDPSLEEKALYNITQAARHYLYFSSEYNLLEPTHVNVKQRHEWIALIEQYGFKIVRFDFPYIPHGLMFSRR